MAQNKHIPHLEDMIFEPNVGGAMISKIYGETIDCDVCMSLKMDGAPAIIAGINPENENFFVSTKSALNVNPILCYNNTDIREHFKDPEIVRILIKCLEKLPNVIQDGIYQGDLLFMPWTKEYDPELCEYSFQMNVIKYTIPQYSKYWGDVRKAQIGIAFHTWYDMTSEGHLEEIEDTFDCFDSIKFDVDDVFCFDTELEMEGYFIRSDIERAYVGTARRYLRNDVSEISPLIWSKYPVVYDIVRKYVNERIWSGNHFMNKEEFFYGFMAKIDMHFTEKINSMSNGMAINRVMVKYHEIRNYLLIEENIRHNMMELFQYWSAVMEAKNILIGMINKEMDKEILCSIEGKSCPHEGYVVKFNNHTVKLVNREEFSKLNQLLSTK